MENDILQTTELSFYMENDKLQATDLSFYMENDKLQTKRRELPMRM